MTAAANVLFFAATDHLRGRELWALTHTGVAPYDRYALDYIDVLPGLESSDPLDLCSSGGALPLYFTAFTPQFGRELWQTDGTAAGTSLVKDLNYVLPPESSSPHYLTWYCPASRPCMLVFQATDGIHGVELWCYTPSTAALLMVDIRPGVGGSNPSFFAPLHSALDGAAYLVFTATDGHAVSGLDMTEGVGGSQLWRTDGTKDGTYRLFHKTSNDLYIDRAALEASYPHRLTVYSRALYLPANYGQASYAIPRGGIRTGPNGAGNNEQRLFGIDQAFVIADTDTPPDGSVTVTMAVDRGLLLLNPSADDVAAEAAGGAAAAGSATGANAGAGGAGGSDPKYKFLVAEARATDTDFIT